MEIGKWEAVFDAWLSKQMNDADAAHDRGHIRRVVRTAKQLANEEQADLAVVVPAAWLHDCVTVPKDSEERHLASRMAADAAGKYLRDIGYPANKIFSIQHAIAAHSFSANISPESIEAKVVQDADRLDAIGAIGIARCLMLGGTMNIPLYASAELIPKSRTPDDKKYVIDHFFVKLFKLRHTMQTASGRKEAEKRSLFMKQFIEQLAKEVV